jgi:acyl dehydratase
MHDITSFAYLSGDWTPLHTDVEVADSSLYGGIVAHGPLILSVAYGLMATAGVFRDAMAWLDLQWTMKQAVKPGDTIRAEVTPRAPRRSKSRPETCIVQLDVMVRNQRDETVAVAISTNMFPYEKSATSAVPSAPIPEIRAASSIPAP